MDSLNKTELGDGIMAKKIIKKGTTVSKHTHNKQHNKEHQQKIEENQQQIQEQQGEDQTHEIQSPPQTDENQSNEN